MAKPLKTLEEDLSVLIWRYYRQYGITKQEVIRDCRALRKQYVSQGWRVPNYDFETLVWKPIEDFQRAKLKQIVQGGNEVKLHLEHLR